MERLGLVKAASILSAQHICVKVFVRVPRGAVEESRVLHEPGRLRVDPCGSWYGGASDFFVVIIIKVDGADS